MGADKCKALVTGGAGFLGEHLIQQLIDSGSYQVTCFDLRKSDVPGCASVSGDITKLTDVETALSGMDIVFHAATCSPTTKNAATAQKLMNDVNVEGTRNIISACLKLGIKKIVYTSSASVVFSGDPLIDIDETYPYAAKPIDYYTGTKAEV